MGKISEMKCRKCGDRIELENGQHWVHTGSGSMFCETLAEPMEADACQLARGGEMDRPSKEDIIENLEGAVNYAYENGYHECGFDPVKEICLCLERLRELLRDTYMAAISVPVMYRGDAIRWRSLCDRMLDELGSDPMADAASGGEER